MMMMVESSASERCLESADGDLNDTRIRGVRSPEDIICAQDTHDGERQARLPVRTVFALACKDRTARPLSI